jgi:hypothetical protein
MGGKGEREVRAGAGQWEMFGYPGCTAENPATGPDDERVHDDLDLVEAVRRDDGRVDVTCRCRHCGVLVTDDVPTWLFDIAWPHYREVTR